MPLLTKKLFSLKTVLILPLALILCLILSVVFYSQKISSEKLINNLSQKVLQFYTLNVQTKLDNFLYTPELAVKNLSHQIEKYDLYKESNLLLIQELIVNNLSLLYNDSHQIKSIAFGGKNKEYVGYRRENQDTEFHLMLKDHRTKDALIIYSGNNTSSPEIFQKLDYDPHVRPWYSAAMNTLQTNWSDIYKNVDDKQEINISATHSILKNGEFLGVIEATINLDTLNDFLFKESQLTKGAIYLIDQQHRLIAHSESNSILNINTINNHTRDIRPFAFESDNTEIRQSAFYIQQHQLVNQNSNELFTFTHNNKRYFNQFTPFDSIDGINWYIVTIISEDEILGTLTKEQENSFIISLTLAIICSLASVYIVTLTIKPINIAIDAAQNIANGKLTNNNITVKSRIYETSILINSFNDMSKKIQLSFDDIRQQIIFDPMTKVLTRQGLIEESLQLEQVTSSQGLLLIGLKNFRDVNDSLGMTEGDLILQHVAERLKFTFPDSSVHIARIVGDEFALFFTNIDSINELTKLIIKTEAIFISPFYTPSNMVPLRISIGSVFGQITSDSMEAWLQHASITLTQAKANDVSYAIYHPNMVESSTKKAHLTRELSSAVTNNEMVPYYQPIIDMKTGDIIGAEALVRWIHPQEGIISPLDFIPIAEDNGMIIPIGNSVLMQACIDTVTQIKSGVWPSNFHMHVNLSVYQLTKHDFLSTLNDILLKTGMLPKNLTLEITESRLVSHDSPATRKMQKIRDLGVQIAIDDFGTGYSSLAYIHKLPFDVLKVDRSFINILNTENADSSIAAAITNMTKGYNITLVAEGIETAEQADIVSKLNYDHAQGFLYSRPLPLNEWPTE